LYMTLLKYWDGDEKSCKKNVKRVFFTIFVKDANLIIVTEKIMSNKKVNEPLNEKTN
jgi:hypothetical protein